MAKIVTWITKLHSAKPSEIKYVERAFSDIPEGSLMLVPNPQTVDTYVRTIPEGKSASLKTMRTDLAAAHSADNTDPVSAPSALHIVAEAAYLQYTEGTPVEEIAPFWRIIDSRSPIFKRLSFGSEFLLEMRKKEGLSV